MLPIIRDVHFEQTPDRLKVVLPVKINWLWRILFSILVVLWLFGLVWAVLFTVRQAFSGTNFAFAFTVMLLVWIYVWYRLGKILWRQWQYYIASREVLFLEKERLIIRRPVSILGITDAYDMAHVSPFQFNDEHQCPSFNYGHQFVYFGRGLAAPAGRQLVDVLNVNSGRDLNLDEYE